MKYTICFPLLLCLMASCNNAEKNTNLNQGGSIIPEKVMREAIAKYPDSLLLKENLVQYYRDSGYYDMALALTDSLIRKDSNNARLWDIKATLHFENDDTGNAVRSFERAVAIVPDTKYLISLGTLYAETKNPKALKLSDLLLADKNATARKEPLFIKGLYFTYTGNKKKAIGLFDQALQLDYTYMFAYREKAIALYDLTKYEEALNVLNKAVTLQNNFDEGYYWTGRCQEKLNRINDAIDSYKTALLYDPGYFEARDALERLGVK